MTDTIDPELFTRLVHLAALELTPKEAEYLRGQLNNQLKAIQQLEAIPLEGDTPLTSHGIPYTRVMSPAARVDEWKPYPDPGDILAQAPESEEGYIVVPEIPHQELE